MAIVRLEEDPSIFFFRKGDRVARRRDDGAPDRQMSGVVTAGTCEGSPGIGSYNARYEVQRKDGLRFLEGEINLVRLLDDEEIKERIRDRFRMGELPRTLPPPPIGELEDHETIVINGGRREKCSACDLIIATDEQGSLELQYPTGLHVRFHAACHALWDTERERPALRKRT